MEIIQKEESKFQDWQETIYLVFFLRIFFPMQPLSWLEKEEIDKTKNADFFP